MVTEKIVLGDAKLKIENIEEFAFNAPDITLSENAGTECPMHIFESGVI
jgi:hypothetical protein